MDMGQWLSQATGKPVPQQNQFQGDQPSNPNNNTSWMAPSTMGGDSGGQQTQVMPQSSTGGAVGSNSAGQNEGTAIGAISSGAGAPSWSNTGITGGGGWMAPSSPQQQQAPASSANPNWAPQTNNAPPGFDAQKWADPSQGTSAKYQVGRIMAAGGSIQDAANAVGAKVISPDKIQYPDGFIADVIYDVGGPNQHLQYTDVTGGGDSGGSFQNQAQQSMLGQNQQMGGGQFGFGAGAGINPQMIQQLMQMMQQQPVQKQQVSQYNFGNNGGYDMGLYNSLLGQPNAQ